MQVAIAAQPQHAHADITGQCLGAEGGGQFATPGGAQEFHLQQAVLRRHKTLCLDQIGRVGGEDIGRAQLIAQHLDRRREAEQLHAAIDLRLARGAQLVVGEGRAQYQQHEQPQGDSFQDFCHYCPCGLDKLNARP